VIACPILRTADPTAHTSAPSVVATIVLELQQASTLHRFCHESLPTTLRRRLVNVSFFTVVLESWLASNTTLTYTWIPTQLRNGARVRPVVFTAKHVQQFADIHQRLGRSGAGRVLQLCRTCCGYETVFSCAIVQTADHTTHLSLRFLVAGVVVVLNAS
jgi:hypothetical protein